MTKFVNDESENISSGKEFGEQIFKKELESENYITFGYKMGSKKEITSKIGL